MARYQSWSELRQGDRSGNSAANHHPKHISIIVSAQQAALHSDTHPTQTLSLPASNVPVPSPTTLVCVVTFERECDVANSAPSRKNLNQHTHTEGPPGPGRDVASSVTQETHTHALKWNKLNGVARPVWRRASVYSRDSGAEGGLAANQRGKRPLRWGEPGSYPKGQEASDWLPDHTPHRLHVCAWRRIPIPAAPRSSKGCNMRCHARMDRPSEVATEIDGC